MSSENHLGGDVHLRSSPSLPELPKTTDDQAAMSIDDSASNFSSIPLDVNHLATRKDLIESKAMNLYSQLPYHARPDMSVVQHFVNSDLRFIIPVKRETLPIPAPFNIVQPIPQMLKPKDDLKSFKKLQAGKESNGYQKPQPKHSDSSSLMPPKCQQADVLKLKKRGRPKLASEVLAPSPKKIKQHKAKKSLAPVTFRGTKSTPELTPPPSSKMIERERSAIPTTNEIVDPSLRRSVRKVYRPKHLATDVENQPPEQRSSEVEVKDYSICAASIPDMLSPTEALNDRDRDELVMSPEALECVDDASVGKYALACEAKVGCDIHTAICHLAENESSIQRALETIDDPGSLPNNYVRSDNAPGLWSGDEIKTFTRLMNNGKSYKRMSKISKHFPNKSTSNIVNAYYALKKNVCSFGREFIPCPEIIKKNKHVLGFDYVDSANCDNCVNKLWDKSVEKQVADTLCSLCMLYQTMYDKLRPNAQPSSPIFDVSNLPHKSCYYETMKDYPYDEEVFIPDWNVWKSSVYAIKKSAMPDFIEAVKDLKIEERAQQIIEEVNDMNEAFTNIFFSEKPLSKLSPFYPKNGLSLIESINSPSASSPPVSEEQPKENGKAELEYVEMHSDEENDGPPVLINENERPRIEVIVPEKPYDIIYFGYLDERDKLHNGYGIEFNHAYTEKLCNYDGSLYLSPSKAVENNEPLGASAKRNKTDAEIIQEYGKISLFDFSQTFIDNKKRFQPTADALNVPLDYMEAYVRHNYNELKTYFSQFERMVRMRARQRKARNRQDGKQQEDRERRITEVPMKQYNYYF